MSKKGGKGNMAKKDAYAAQEAKWQAEDDARTLERAMEIQKDGNRVKKAHDVTLEKLKNIQEVARSTGKLAKKATPAKKKGRKR